MNRRPNVTTYAIAAISMLAALGFLQFGNDLFSGNLHTVIPDQVYRAAQPTPASITHWTRTIGLRSVINLKGQGAGSTAYTQAADAGQLDVRYVRLSARRWPSPAEIEKLVSHLESAERPVLIHCQGGTDRSGLAAAIALLLAGESPELASEQFSLKFGYPGPVLGSDLPGFLASYRAWLSDRNLPHTPMRFRNWVSTDYVAYYYEADIAFDPLPADLRAGEPFSLTLRVTNRSGRPIPMSCSAGEGVRLSLRLRPLVPGTGQPEERRLCSTNSPLPPAASTVVVTGTYDIEDPGLYEFSADLVDEFEEHFFADMGSQIARQTIAIH